MRRKPGSQRRTEYLRGGGLGQGDFYGPSMEDFSEEKALLEDVGCGTTIKSEEELLQEILQALKNPEELQRRGDRGKSVILANIGAAARYADLISKYI